MINEIEKGNLMMLAGCLHDIAEKTKEDYTQRQALTVKDRLLSMVGEVDYDKIISKELPLQMK